MQFIDIHSHILPGIDDGATSFEESIGMLETGFYDGIKKVIATPHFMYGAYERYADEVKKIYNILIEEKTKAGLEIEIYLGQEIYAEETLTDDLKEMRVLSLNNTNYVLIEMPVVSLSRTMEKIIFDLIAENYHPILAHPERNTRIIKNPAILYQLVFNGALVQQDAGSLIGEFGREVANVSKIALENNWVHFIGSDAHSIKGRPLKLSDWYQIALKIKDEKFLKDIVWKNPLDMLENKELSVREPKMYKEEQNGFFQRLFNGFKF